MLINIGQIDAVKIAINSTMTNQLNTQLMSPTIYDLAVINLLQSLGQSREQVEMDLN